MRYTLTEQALICDTLFHLLKEKPKPVIPNENDTFDLPIFVLFLFLHDKTFRIGKNTNEKFSPLFLYVKKKRLIYRTMKLGFGG